MKKRKLLTCLSLIFALELIALIIFAAQDTRHLQDMAAVNEILHSVQNDWDAMEQHNNQTALDYVILDKEGTVLFRTGEGLSESINAAVRHRDTILTVETDHTVAGRLIIYNDSALFLQSQKERIIIFLSAALFLQCCICVGYIIYLDRIVVRPFDQLKGFAERIAEGNLDIPLTMDRHNLFGAFTESFDIMRSELKRARIAEAEANTSKKELVAKLSHDIKTPVASIKAASEVGVALTDDGKIKDNYTQIIHKTDQINMLITNLFTATLEELRQLSVAPADVESRELYAILESADYLHRTGHPHPSRHTAPDILPPAYRPDIPDCLLYADKLRLQQVFDNIFANSYKYANTGIEVTVQRTGGFLTVSIEDYGGGVNPEELPLLKEKFKRGSNAGAIEGAGLGLYISDFFMQEMQGNLILQNGENGLKVIVMIALSGVI